VNRQEYCILSFCMLVFLLPDQIHYAEFRSMPFYDFPFLHPQFSKRGPSRSWGYRGPSR
jgi:hypothetical protein